jgi:hypothetical protein
MEIDVMDSAEKSEEDCQKLEQVDDTEDERPLSRKNSKIRFGEFSIEKLREKPHLIK